MEYNKSGLYISIAGIVCSILAHYNIIISQDSALAVLSGIITLAGIIKQATDHKKLAVAASSVGYVSGLSD